MTTSSIIIVEGPDGSGKSTYIDTILRYTFPTLPIIHGGGPPKIPQEIMERVDMVASSPTGMILDRWTAISECVYGKVMRGAPLINEDRLLYHVTELHPLIIYCRPALLTIIQNLKGRDQSDKDWKDPEHIARVEEQSAGIIVEYDRIMEKLIRLGANVVRYNYEV